MRFITGKKPCFWRFMGKDCNLVIVKDQSNLIYVPGFDKNDAVAKFPLHFFHCICFLFIESFGKWDVVFQLLKLYYLECQLFRSGFFSPVAFIRTPLLLYITFYVYFPSVLRCSIAICALKGTWGPCFSAETPDKPRSMCPVELPVPDPSLSYSVFTRAACTENQTDFHLWNPTSSVRIN